MDNGQAKQTISSHNMMIYTKYLLRYVSLPVTAAQLQKKATEKHFSRLANYFEDFPPDMVFEDKQSVLDLLSNNTNQTR